MYSLAVLFSFSLAAIVTGEFLLGGFKVTSPVQEHSEIDLDQKEMEQKNDLFKFAAADKVYSKGKNSAKSDGLRTLRGFSTEAKDKLKCEPYFELFRKYYKRPNYADKFVQDALKGKGQFKGNPPVFRSECAAKGSQYQNVWMYVIHEMEDAINDCVRGALEMNDRGVKAWDEAWAFYCGSLIGPKGKGDSVLIYSLAQKRCVNFGTCKASTAKVNINVRNLFTKGKKQLDKGQCSAALKTKNEIVKQMTAPLVQGVMQYIVVTDPNQSMSKAHAEGWAFTSAVLPLVNNCKSSVAKLLVKNFKPSAKKPMGDGVDLVAKQVYSVLACLGLKCTDVGKAAGLPMCRSRGAFKVIKGSKVPSCKTCKTC